MTNNELDLVGRTAVINGSRGSLFRFAHLLGDEASLGGGRFKVKEHDLGICVQCAKDKREQSSNSRRGSSFIAAYGATPQRKHT